MTSPIPFRRSAQAFTLVELLTVIAIIGILAALLIPTVGKVRTDARDAQCMANIREWGRAIQLYAHDHKGSYTFNDWASAASDGPYKPYLTDSSTKAKQYRVCPLMPQDKIDAGSLTYAIVRGAINGSITSFISNSDMVPLARARNPTQYMLLCDAQPNNNTYLTGSLTVINTLVSPLFDASLAAGGEQDAAQRHGSKRINAVFADGSTRRITGTAAGKGDRNSIYEMRTTWLQLY